MVPLQGRPLSELLRISGLVVRYGAHVALSDLDLTVVRGELFVLLGGSGSGKSTLLRAIGGFVRPDAGRIELDGSDLGPLPPHRRPVNTMFQSYALFPHLTVAANVAFGLRQRGVSRTDAATRAREMLALVRLEGLENRRPNQLSGGQQQRVALARSLAADPALLLLDEPLSALDRGLRAETRVELTRLNRRLGTTFILVTHDQEEALTMADRIGIMNDGRMAQVGTPAEVYEHPNSRFVAGFMGAANILSGTLRADGMTFDCPALGAVLHASRPGIPGRSWLAVRAERMRVGEAGLPNRLEATVTERAYAGESLLLRLRLADGSELRVTQSLADGLPAVEDLREGAAVTVGWQADASILLPE